MILGPMQEWISSARPALLGLSVFVLAFASVDAVRAEPPITSVQDAYCRNEARNRVFATPDPQNLGAHAIGRAIYNACMRKVSSAGRSHKGRRRHHRRRHR